MKSIKKHNIIEPDFSSELEEIAEIPEKVSAGTEVDGESPSPGEVDVPHAGGGDLEERAVPFGAHDEPRIIVDEYAGEHSVSISSRAEKRPPLLKKELTAGDALAQGNEFDIGSFAAEIDALVKREPKQAPKTEPEPGPARRADRADNEDDLPLVSRHMDFMDTPEEDDGSVSIEEDDDIDLDYYSLDELKSGMSDPLESFEFTPPVKEPPRPREEAAESKKETGGKPASPREPVKKKKRAVRDNTITIEIPEDLRKKLPEGFSMDDLGIIDLREAEAIANEGIILLTEDELIDELEEFDLSPGEISRPSAAMEEAAREESEEAEEAEEADEGDEPVRVFAEEEILEESPRDDSPADEITEAGGVEAEAGAPPDNIPPADERLSGSDGKEIDHREEQPVLNDEAHRVMESAWDEKEHPAVPVRDHRPEPEETEDLSAVDESFTAVEETLETAASPVSSPPEAEPVGDTESGPVFEETIEVDRRYAEKEAPASAVRDFHEPLPAEAEPAAEEEEFVVEKIPSTAKPPVERASLMVREVLPAQLLKPREGEGAVRFIDDGLVETPDDRKDSTFTVDELERISSEIIQVVEGDAMLLVEGDSYDDFTRVAGIMRGTSPAFEDLLQDLKEEQVYRDDEIGFVSSVFEAEDYGDYIKTIDEKPGRASGRRESSAVEIMGLEKREISELENSVFMKEYEKINIEEALGGIRPGMDQPRDDVRLLKRCRFIMTRPDSLSPEERESIEEDVLSDTALVYEENVDQVKERLDELKKHQPHLLPGSAVSDAVVAGVAPAASADISDRVFIIDDKNDLERFFSTIPEDKRENLTKLLKYLDGLFEKLPEDVIRNFASSEYFDIYTKVLNDLGV